MTRSRSILFVLGLALAASAPACMVSGSGTLRASTTPVVVYQEPPADQVETVSERPGHVWVKGRWDWRNGQWVWIGGRWEQQRQGQMWTHGRWERRGNQWHWVEGTWAQANIDGGAGVSVTTTTTTHETHTHDHHGGGGVVVTGGGGAPPPVTSGGVSVTPTNPMYPTQAPPPARAESYGAPRAGFIWVTGRWDWRNGAWAWADGHWERQQANMVWVAGRWELQGNYYVWIDGRWDRAAPAGPVIRDHRK